MTIQYDLRKNYRNDWEARSISRLTELPVAADGSYKRLEILTTKRYDGSLVTTATVNTIEPKGFVTHMMFQDYNVRLIVTGRRCTEKAIRAQHELALSGFFARAKRDALAHYGVDSAEVQTEAVA